MGRLISKSPSAVLEELRDGQAFPVSFFTGLGRNGSRQFQLVDQQRQPIDLTSIAPSLVVKTSPDALDTELDANFPLSSTVDNAGQGLFTVDFATINFLAEQPSVMVIVYDSTGTPIVLAQMRTVIRKAGV